MAASRTLVLLTVLFPLVLPAVLRMTCEGDWIGDDEFCVWISDHNATNWEAIEECKRMGGDLLYINNIKENSMAAGIMLMMNVSEMWTGLNDMGPNKVYKWEGHEDLLFTNFYPGKAYSRKRHPRDCVSMTESFGFKWTSKYCFSHLIFMCRKNLP